MSNDKKNKRISSKLYKYWKNFDENFLKPKLIHNWPYVKDEHEEISRKIQDVINDEKIKKITVKLRTLPIQKFTSNDKDLNKSISLHNDEVQKR